MGLERPPGGLSRRTLLGSLPAVLRGAAQKAGDRGRLYETETKRYADGTTEFPVYRLTNPKFTSWLPDSHGRAVWQRNSSLLYSSDRSGTMQAFRLDIKSGVHRQLTDAEKLDPATLAWVAGDRQFCYFDGPGLHLASTGSLHERQIYSLAEDATRGAGFALAEDGRHAMWVERQGDRWRLRLMALGPGAASTVVDLADEIRDPVPRPRRAGILYRRGGQLWLVNYDGQQNRPLRTEPGGATGPAVWGPDGRTILYLHFPGEAGQLNTLRELAADTGEDKLIAKTTQFVTFGVNGDASVFVGASGSKASPHVLLLLRSTRREFTLCEHRASHPAAVAPVFSPNSQRVYFHSDLDGQPALYMMIVERLVADTEPES